MTARSRSSLAFLRSLDRLADLVGSIGSPCWVSGPTGAALLQFDQFALKDPFHLAVPNARAPHRVGAHVHRLREVSPLDTTTAFGIPCLSATRLLIDLGATETPKRLTVALDSALRDGLTTEAFLHRRIVELRRPGRAGIPRLLSVIDGVEITRGGHSYLERAFLELVDELDLPRPQPQRVVGLRGATTIRVDCLWPDTKVVVELLGYRFHRSNAQMQADAERINRMQLDGHLVVQFTYEDVVSRSASMLATLAEIAPRLGARRRKRRSNRRL